MFENHTKKEIKGMIEALLKLSQLNRPDMKVCVSRKEGAKEIKGRVLVIKNDRGQVMPDPTDTQATYLTIDGVLKGRIYGPAWCVLIALNQAYFRKEKRGPKVLKKYEPAGIATAIEYLHQRDNYTYAEGERVVASLTCEEPETVKRYRRAKKKERERFTHMLITQSDTWGVIPNDPIAAVRTILSMIQGGHIRGHH